MGMGVPRRSCLTHIARFPLHSSQHEFYFFSSQTVVVHAQENAKPSLLEDPVPIFMLSGEPCRKPRTAKLLLLWSRTQEKSRFSVRVFTSLASMLKLWSGQEYWTLVVGFRTIFSKRETSCVSLTCVNFSTTTDLKFI